MQKLLTLTIDIESLQASADGAFSLSEIDALNHLLREGWVLESWEFVSADTETRKPVILAVLNDGMDGVGFEESFYEMDDSDDDNDEDFDQDAARTDPDARDAEHD